VWTKGHDKVGVGVTEESHKIPWYGFPWEGRHREEKADGDEGKGGGSKSMSTASDGDRGVA
jgi:hypothetical protein